MDIPPPARIDVYLVVFWGEHVLLRKGSGGELTIPYTEYHPSMSTMAVKLRLESSVGDRGQCVWTRIVKRKEPENVVSMNPPVIVLTSNFFGYYPSDYVAIKPQDFAGHTIAPSHRQYIEDAVNWRKELDLEQSKLENALKSVLDPNARSGF